MSKRGENICGKLSNIEHRGHKAKSFKDSYIRWKSSSEAPWLAYSMTGFFCAMQVPRLAFLELQFSLFLRFDSFADYSLLQIVTWSLETKSRITEQQRKIFIYLAIKFWLRYRNLRAQTMDQPEKKENISAVHAKSELNCRPYRSLCYLPCLRFSMFISEISQFRRKFSAMRRWVQSSDSDELDLRDEVESCQKDAYLWIRHGS